MIDGGFDASVGGDDGVFSIVDPCVKNSQIPKVVGANRIPSTGKVLRIRRDKCFEEVSWVGVNVCLLYTSPSPRDS